MQPRGLSLLELLVAISLMAVLGSVLLWRTSDTRGATITRATNDLQALVQRGRLEAIARNRQTLLTFNATAETVTLCVENSSPNGSCELTDTVLETWRATQYGLGLDLNSTSFTTPLRWTPVGIPSGLTGTPSARVTSGGLSRNLCVSLAGQVSVRQGTC